MKLFNILIVTFMVFSTCLAQNKPLDGTKTPLTKERYEYFGTQFADSNAINSGKMLENYEKMSRTDTLVSKFSGLVTEVCMAKGCWMKLRMGNGEETMVKFKDYGFFVPQELVGKEVIVNGLAFVEEMSVKDQRHFASDGGRSEEEIARIKQVRKKYAFEADGVLIKN
ncbi:DUF4920 domain-containing protein [Arenibacter sp. F20364]|uniref:DUF4920 domain-containing protein n=1 Tax=Arenibacter sp. F20364 TaxID=2926415 RepID=UPI001FF0F83A|nr:DUF4920 domain-containing protein [Arenibacter sp. F20364]MCK0190200.1 DUF4920 domain-containing protein [Arenibacter sp. F20364]